MKHSLLGRLPKDRSELKKFIKETRHAIERNELLEYEEHQRAETIRRLQALFDKRSRA